MTMDYRLLAEYEQKLEKFRRIVTNTASMHNLL